MFPESNLSHVPRPQGSRIKPQSCCQATGFHHQTSDIFPGHRVPESTDVMFPGHSVPESILSYVPRLQGSRIKPQSCSQSTGFQNQGSVRFPGHSIPQSKQMSCSQATGFQNHASVMFPGHRDPESNLVIFPGHRFPESNQFYVPRQQGTRIEPMSCSQATSFHSLTSDMFPGHRVPESNRSHVPRPQGSRIHRCHVPRPQGSRINPQLCSLATGFQNKTSVMFPVHRGPEPRLSQVPRAQYSTI